jgi:UDP-N-acetylglucosamine:LPS N-acetylglucosamine transferase
MVKRILIPYLRAGLGHLVQAQAIATSLRRMRPDWDVHCMDAAAELNDELLQKNFVDLWRTLLSLPGPLTAAAFGLEKLAPWLVRALNRSSFRTAVPKAATWLAEHPTDLVMSTHWACSHLFSMARALTSGRAPSEGAEVRPLPIFYLYGELQATYSVAECGADLYFALSDTVRDGLAGLGIDRSRIRTVPLVVDPAMVRARAPREVLRRGLGIPADSLAVVLSLGGEGIGRTLPFIRAFARDATGATLVVIALGFQEDLSPVVGSADVLAGKCGTGFAAMAMTTGIPLIVTHLGAPNERGNMRFIVEHGHGWFCPRPAQFVRRIAALAKDRTSCTDRSGRAVPATGAETIAQAIVEAVS